MTLQEIAGLKIDNYFLFLTERLLPTITYDQMTMEGVGYDKLFLHRSFTKPTLAKYKAEFKKYKAELKAVEDARLADIAKVKDMTARIAKLQDFHSIQQLAGLPNTPNSAVELKRILDDRDDATLAKLEAVLPAHLAKKAKDEIKRVRKDKGSKKKRVCEEILDLINGENDEAAKTEAEVDAMILSFKAIYDALKERRPAKVRRLVELIPYDGSIDSLKDDILEELTDNGF